MKTALLHYWLTNMRGGALETVKDGETGLFFAEQTVESLCQAIEEFEARPWSSVACRNQAQQFSAEAFRREFSQVVDGL